MYLANAYPNSALSAGALTAIALVIVAVLAFWLIMVYVADRPGREKNVRENQSTQPVAELDEATQDRHSEASPAPAVHQHGAA